MCRNACAPTGGIPARSHARTTTLPTAPLDRPVIGAHERRNSVRPNPAWRPQRRYSASAWPTSTGAAFSPEGKRIASPSTDKTARVWDAESGSELARVARDKWIAGVAFSPDGGRIATATRDGTARLGDRQRPRTDPGRPRILGDRGSRSAPAGRVIASVVNRFPGGSLRASLRDAVRGSTTARSRPCSYDACECGRRVPDAT